MALVAMGMAVSCSDPENSDNNANYQPDRGQGVAPVVVSVSPQDGATDLDTIKVFTIEYDKPIFSTPHASIKINDAYVADSAVTVKRHTLQLHKEYTHHARLQACASGAQRDQGVGQV